MTMNVVLILVLVASFERSLAIRTPSFSDKEIECYAQEKVYHEATGNCYKLLTQGPCPEGQWFVLEKPRESSANTDSKIKAVCINEKCKDRTYFWSATNSCVQAKDKQTLCGESSEEELLNNVFGEGECICKREPPRARLHGEKKNPCYPLYSQGPCPQGQVLGYPETDDDDDIDTEQADCINDSCYQETMYRRRLGTLPKNSILAAWENGTCYELGTRGPCPESHTFKDCYQDENGDCQKRINSNKYQNAEKYRVELFNSVSAARKRRTISRNRNKSKTKPLPAEVLWTAHYN